MEVIIDIGEAVYEAIKEPMQIPNRHSGKTMMLEHLMEVINEGTPIPKGRWYPCEKGGLILSEIMLRTKPSMWYGYKCSNCGFVYKGNALTESPYCQHCRAKMGEESADSD